MGHGPHLDLWDSAQKGTEFEGTAHAAGEGSSSHDVPRKYPQTLVRQHRPQDGVHSPDRKLLGHRKEGSTHSIGST